MNQIKNTLTLILLFAFAIIGQSQNCYEIIADMSGFDTSPYQAELENAACELKNAFPAEFQDQFKVYDFGFYSQNEFMQGGFQAVWDKVVAEIPTDYYLIFGKQTDRTGIYTKFWVEVKLPTTNNFSCFESDFFNLITFQIKKTVSDNFHALGGNPHNYANAEIAGIAKLKDWIFEIVNCCEPDPGLRSNCSICSWTYPDIIDYYIDNQFYISNCTISESLPIIDSLCLCNTDYEITPQKSEGNNYEVELVTNLSSFYLDTNEIDVNILYSNIEELGKLYGEQGNSFYGAVTDQNIFCSSIPVVAMRNSSEMPTHNEVLKNFNSAEKGVWISITYTNNVAKYAIKTKGMNLLVENSGVGLLDILDYVGVYKEKSSIENLNYGFYHGHFYPGLYGELFRLTKEIKSNLQTNPVLHRLEYIAQIEKISNYLAKRHQDYGEGAQYLNDLIEPLSYEEYFTGNEVYQVYKLSVDWYLECKGRYISELFSVYINAAKPFIEFALIESGFSVLGQIFTVTANASWKVTSLLPQSVKTSAQLVWDRIAFTSAFRPNSLIPETFKLTSKSTEKFYVQYSGTEHLHELVALRKGAATKPWFESQKALRSQLVLDDFARAVDDIVTNNPNLIMDKLYTAGKWEVKFGAQTSTVQSDGLRRIYHAQPLPQ